MEDVERSAIGGFLNKNKYLIKNASKGDYIIKLMRSQLGYENLFGHEHIYVTIYRNWGRPNQSQEVIVKQIESLSSDREPDIYLKKGDVQECANNSKDKIPEDQIAVIGIE